MTSSHGEEKTYSTNTVTESEIWRERLQAEVSAYQAHKQPPKPRAPVTVDSLRATLNASLATIEADGKGTLPTFPIERVTRRARFDPNGPRGSSIYLG
mmetsp:Transcript_18967/g.47203  ORF Transcript_18967/g.47203 Transcript_18967/m.47203 type:complete len:98 (-) Transcript_18967:116-409(-)